MFDTMLTRDIRQMLDDFRRSVDRFFSDVYRFRSAPNSESVFTPAVESAFADGELILRVILPGIARQECT